MKKWECTICGYIHEGDEPPDECPVCGADKSKFVEIKEEEKPAESSSAQEAEAVEKEPDTSTAASEPAAAATKKKETLSGFDQIKDLLVKHHLHPITVHTPNGILPIAVIMLLLSWVSGNIFLGKAAALNLFFVILALPVVIFTGIVEWKKKYQGAVTGKFKIKIAAASVTAAGSVITLAWYLIDNTVLTSSGAWIFILIACITVLAAGLAGHIGGKLVFKD